MTNTKRCFLIALIILLNFVDRRPVMASDQVLITGYNGPVDAGSTIVTAYQNFTMPKFSPSGSSAYSGQLQIQYIDTTQYNFVYLRYEHVVLFGVSKYHIEVSYQTFDTLHENWLSDYALPGDSIDWVYNDLQNGNASVRILNTPASGHTGWDHTQTFAWGNAVHPTTYTPTLFNWHVESFGLSHNCSGDMPAQDTPHSTSHVTTLNYLAFVVNGNNVMTSIVVLPVAGQNTNVSPTNCGITATTGTYGPYTTNVITSYGGG